MAEDLSARIARAESRIDSLEQLYNQLRQDVTELRADVSELKSAMGDLKVENVQHFSEIKDLINGLTNKALNSLPPWGAIVTMVFGALAGAIAGALLGHVWR